MLDIFLTLTKKYDLRILPYHIPFLLPHAIQEKHVIAQRRVRRREERSAADPLGQAGEEIAGIEGGDIGCGVRGLGWLSQQMDDEGRSVDEDY